MRLTSVVFVVIGTIVVLAAVIWYANPSRIRSHILGYEQTIPIVFHLEGYTTPPQSPQAHASSENTAQDQTDAAKSATSSPLQDASGVSTGGSYTPQDTGYPYATDDLAEFPTTPASSDDGTDDADEYASSTVSGPVSAEISVSPTLVGSGSKANLSWWSRNAASCTVTGTNGDVWKLLASEAMPSGAIKSPTTFTLVCKGGKNNPETVTKSVKVQVAPSYSSQ